MKTTASTSLLRLLVVAPIDASTMIEWATFDAAGRALGHGRDSLADCPRAERTELVLPATRVRTIALQLPPIAGGKLAQAAAFAVEDRLAAPLDTQHLAVSGQTASGTVRVAICERAWLRTVFDAATDGGVDVAEIIAEADLAPTIASGWMWCRSAADSGFVRFPDGGSMAVGAVDDDGALPIEIVAALNGAPVAGDPGALVVHVTFAASPEALTRWSEQTGTRFVAAPNWHWYQSQPPSSLPPVPMLTGPFSVAAAPIRGRLLTLFRPALYLVVAAVVLEVVATTGDWLLLHWRFASMQRDLATVATTVVPDAPQDSDPKRVIANRYAELRHQRGLTADSDLLPLLARATPALATLPPGIVRAMTFADGHAVFELNKIDPTALGAVQRSLQTAGLVAIAVPTAAGARLRLGLD